METQDHKKPKQSGYEGHSGGVHVCTKCGWPFPKPHPSAKHRRAHKKVCGTVEGYRLDNDAQDKTHLMVGSDGEHASDDEHKTPSGKVVETTINRRTSSGVGNRSSRSTRSEDEVFTDAVTEFADTPSPGEASDGIQRFYSMQRVTQNDLDDIKHAAEKADADKLGAPSTHLNDNQDQVQPVQNLEGDNDRIEAGILSQDQIPSFTSGPAPASALITIENESEDEAADEIVLSKGKSEPRTSYNETTEEASEDVSVLGDMDKGVLGPVSDGELAKSVVMKITGSENNVECSQAAGQPVEVIDPASGGSAKLSDVTVDHGLKSGANADVYVLAAPDALPPHKHPERAVKDFDHETSESKKVYSENDILKSVDVMEGKLNQDVGQKSIAEQNPVGEPVQLPDVEASEGDVSNFSCEVVSDLKTENLGEKISCAEEQKPTIALNNVFPEEQKPTIALHNVFPEEQKPTVALNNVFPEEQKPIFAADNPECTSNGASNTSNGVKINAEHVVLQEIIDNEVSRSLLSASDVGTTEFRNEVVSDFKNENLEEKNFSCAEEQKPIVALNNVFPEEQKPIVALNNVFPEEQKPLVAADNHEFTSNGASNGVKSNSEHVFSQEIGNNDVSGGLLLAEHAINDILPQSKELSNIHDGSDTGNNENIGAAQTHLDGSGGEGNEAVNAETAPSGSIIAGSRDGIHETFEANRFHDHVKSDKTVDPRDVIAGHTLPMVESTGGSSGGAECTSEDGLGAISKTDNLPGSISKMISTDSSAVCYNAQLSLKSSATVDDTFTDKSAEEADVFEGDRIVKPHIAISGADILPDSSSQTDSLEGNWGSVSVMSAVSDTPPANDTPALNQSQVSASKDNGILDVKPMMGSQHPESKSSVDPVVGAIGGVSEIQTLEEQKEKGSALQSSWSTSVAHLDNAPHGGKRNEEIIAKVTNWSTEKQHLPLKTLLGEATARSRAESPIHTHMKPQTDETPVANNDASKTENVILSSNNPIPEASKIEMGKEWNSPARYPVNIKTEKRKGKNKPYWAPFLCCSSVNAR
ncbi:uncharacterized protein LOC110714904 [Chenopodium quinoa]|uniref:C2H2-type domain-containing protein n=1 Tax=Chenopodium quinoa TaxID=63459 RepID=A0A803LZI1_CHEQI|nr:uncharacterized protein LOC110714904 [Chenopodium quinoa]